MNSFIFPTNLKKYPSNEKLVQKQLETDKERLKINKNMLLVKFIDKSNNLRHLKNKKTEIRNDQ